MDRANVDTDQIIPKQFLKRIERTGYGPFLFFDWRYLEDNGEPNPTFELNRPGCAGVERLLGTAELRLRFEPRARGMGDRELRLSRGDRAELRRHLLQQLLQERRAADPAQRGAVDDLFHRFAKYPGYELTVDLEQRRITDNHGLTSRSRVDPSRRHDLLNGLDDIALTLMKADRITVYETQPAECSRQATDRKHAPCVPCLLAIRAAAQRMLLQQSTTFA